MALHNADKAGKGWPRPRVRIVGMSIQVVKPAMGQGARVAASGASAWMRAAEALRAQNLGEIAASTRWADKASFLNRKVGGGVLTFGVNGAIDVYNSVERTWVAQAVWGTSGGADWAESTMENALDL